jgi:lipoyl-dependent peroxiredoxin
MEKVVYTAEARVTGGRSNGHGRTADGVLDVAIRLPKELGGEGQGTNPEQLFAVGYAACFESVLTLVAQRRHLAVDDLTIDSRVRLIATGGGRYKLGAELDLTLPSIGSPEEAAQLAREAHALCPYSNATRGNIDVAIVANGVALQE